MNKGIYPTKHNTIFYTVTVKYTIPPTTRVLIIQMFTVQEPGATHDADEQRARLHTARVRGDEGQFRGVVTTVRGAEEQACRNRYLRYAQLLLQQQRE